MEAGEQWVAKKSRDFNRQTYELEYDEAIRFFQLQMNSLLLERDKSHFSDFTEKHENNFYL